MRILNKLSSKAILLPFLLLFNFCTPKALTKITNSYPALKDYEPFAVFDLNDTTNLTAATIIGEIEIKDGAGLTFRCDYETVVKLAAQKARELGANILKIYEHRQPDIMWSTCHRIKAKALLLKDVSPYEKEIVWNEERKLKQTDFKASTINRPFEAVTSTTIRYSWSGTVISGKATFKVESVFSCQDSYFKNTLNPFQLLAHEQGHFDITEIFARKFVKAVKEQVNSFKELEQSHDKIYGKINREWQIMQDKYDYELYNEKSSQEYWTQKIHTQLDSLNNWKIKEIALPLKPKK